MGQGKTDTRAELERAESELEHLLGSDHLRRPCHPLVEPGDRRRDPSPLWDTWYNCVSVAERRELLPFMAPAGRGLSLDELAGELFCSVDVAFQCWRDACQAVRTARRHARTAARTTAEQLADTGSELYAAEWEQFDAEQLRAAELAIYGPQELAKDLGVTPALIHQWRKRGKLPDADLVVSGVPLWHIETLRSAGVVA